MGSNALVTDMNDGLEALMVRVDALAAQLGRIDAQHDTLRAVLHEVVQSVGMCLDALADRREEGGTPETAKMRLKRAVADREFFAKTLADSQIRALPLARIFPGIERQAVEIGAIDPDTRHANHVDMLYVCAIARHHHARRIFEFGTYLGRTTYHLTLGADVEQVLTLDLPPSAGHGDNLHLGRAVRTVLERDLQGYFFRGGASERRIVQLHGDSRTFDYSPYYGSIDVVFVDGGHSYELIASDTERAFRMLRPGGVVIWHDFAPKSRDVVKFARELSMTRPLFWVRDTSLLVYIDGVNSMTYDAPPVPVFDRSMLKGAPARSAR